MQPSIIPSIIQRQTSIIKWIFYGFLVFVFTIQPVFAQEIIIEPRPIPIDPPPQPIPMQPAITIDLHSVDAVIDGPLATVRVKQVFRNTGNTTVEGSYIFPLPADAAVGDFQMTVDGQVMEGKLHSQAEARRIYEEIVRSLRDPALLEYLGRGLFQTSVFPIPAGATRTLEFSYSQALPQNEGLYHFSYPLRRRQGSQSGQSAVGSIAVRVELRNQPGLRTIYSPNHRISIDRSNDQQAVIGYEAKGAPASTDFSLYFGTDKANVGVNLLTYQPSGEDGYLLLLAAPGSEIEQKAIVQRDIVVVLDVSGSMQGDKIVQAQQAVRAIVDQLNPGDRLNLISFSTGVQLWQSSLQAINEQTRSQARTWIDQITASGSTDINRALLEGMAQFTQAETNASGTNTSGTNAPVVRPAYLLFFTDGLPTQGETDAGRILDNVRNNLPKERSLRLFSFGVGYDVNTDLLDTLSNQQGGRSSYVEPNEAIDEKVSEFYAQIGKPVLANIQLDFGKNIVVDELYPYPLPDLFVGEQQVIVGRYRLNSHNPNGETAEITLKGEVNGEQVTLNYPQQRFVGRGGDPFIARLWATRKIGILVEQARRTGTNQEIIDAITDLSLTYGIVTPYTSYLVQEPVVLAQQMQSTMAGGDSRGGEQPEAAQAAPQAIQETAQKAVESTVNNAAYADASGASAVAASETRNQLQQAVVVDSSTAQEQSLRFAGGRTFTRQVVANAQGNAAELWVDTGYLETMQLESVAFGSDRYFALAQEPTMAEMLGVSAEVLIVLDETRALRITNTEAAAQAPVSPLATPTSEPIEKQEESKACTWGDWFWGGCKD